MIVLGLTGSIGMGKSTTARLFADEGISTHDSDASVHEFYSGVGAPMIAAAFPDAIFDGKVDRQKLSSRVLGDSQALQKLESIVHPFVASSRDAFLRATEERGDDMAVLDIPLLFETGGDNGVDVVVVASAPADVQRARVLARPGMTPEKFEHLLSRQIPDAEKRRRADFVVETGGGIDPAKEQVRAIIRAVRSGQPARTKEKL